MSGDGPTVRCIWPLKEVTEWLADEDNFAYLADDGFVVYNWSGSDLCVDEIVAGSEATARALWATVGSGSSIARTVHAYISAGRPDAPAWSSTRPTRTCSISAGCCGCSTPLLRSPHAGSRLAPLVEIDLRLEDPDVPGEQR